MRWRQNPPDVSPGSISWILQWVRRGKPVTGYSARLQSSFLPLVCLFVKRCCSVTVSVIVAYGGTSTVTAKILPWNTSKPGMWMVTDGFLRKKLVYEALSRFLETSTCGSHWRYCAKQWKPNYNMETSSSTDCNEPFGCFIIIDVLNVTYIILNMNDIEVTKFVRDI